MMDVGKQIYAQWRFCHLHTAKAIFPQIERTHFLLEIFLSRLFVQLDVSHFYFFILMRVLHHLVIFNAECCSQIWVCIDSFTNGVAK